MFGKACEAYDMPTVLDGFPYSVFDFVVKEDHAMLIQMTRDMRMGLQTICDIRLKATDGTHRWHRNEYILHYDAAGKPIEAIGKLVDIHEQKLLEIEINNDGLTGCLRKKAFEVLSAAHIATAGGKTNAFFIVDLDNFKAINDNLGHQFGDTVLRETGERLRQLFRASDYIGRVGGDEFMVFMRDVGDVSLVAQKAAEIVKALDVTYEGKTRAYHLSASVGIAVSPSDGDDFLTLYKNADIALYDVKNRGKNGYMRYHSALSKGTMENTTPFDVAARSVSQHFNPELVADIFDLLFESKELDLSVHQALQRVGRQLGVSRCYVFEQSKTVPGAYSNTYEWCAQGVTPEIDNLQNLPADVLCHFFDKANEAGVFYCNELSALNDEAAYDLMEAQGVQSFLHTYVYTGGRVSYVFGFDECARARIWSPMEISTVMYVGRIVAQFLNYKNAIEVVNAISEDRLAILDAQASFSYIIDPDTHALRYFNQAVQNMLPNLKIGDICYQKLRGFAHECDNCPLRAMRNKHEPTARDIIYNKILDIYVLVEAITLPQFEGKTCIFVSSNNVTDFIDPAHPCVQATAAERRQVNEAREAGI